MIDTQSEIKQLIEMHDAIKERLIRRQYANELSEAITQKIIIANNVCEETVSPELASYNKALREVLAMLNPVSEDPERVAAAIQMGFIHERKGYNPYME